MRSFRTLTLGALALFLAGCATWTPGGAPHHNDKGYTLTVPAGWTFHPSAGGALLATRDGLVLQNFSINRVQLPHKLPLSKRELTTKLTPYELAEIFADEGKADRTLSKFAVARQTAVKISGGDAVRYDFSHATQDGLRISGRRWLIRGGDFLWVATYTAPSRYYFDRDLASITSAVEAMRLDPFAAPHASTNAR